MIEIIKYWRDIELGQNSLVHREDKAYITKDNAHQFTTADNFYSQDYLENPYLFHTGLIPTPYMGDLKNAQVFILMLNPGLSFDDYHAECNDPDYKAALVNNLKQKEFDPDYPFLFLNPNYLWHTGGMYWFKKFKSHILHMMKKDNISILEATKRISKKVAVLQLFPYHSSQFRLNKEIERLPSTVEIKRCVLNNLVKKAFKGEICIICTRKSDLWNLPTHDNILKYKGNECRAAHISEKTRAFPLIQKFLNK
jgi:hypothetical protein